MFPLLLLACSEYRVHGDKNQPATETVDSATSTTTETTLTDTTETTGTTGHTTQTTDTTTDPEAATEEVYINTSTSLYSYDPSLNKATYIGDFSEGGITLTSMTDIAIDLNGHLYGVAFSDLYQIDPHTADCTLVDVLSEDAVGLSFLADGRLVVAGLTVFLYDPANGKKTPLVTGNQYITSGDIVGLPDGYLYWIVTGTNSDMLIQIDPQSGATKRIGPLDGSQFFGVGYANNTLYAFSSNGDILAVDPGNAKTISNTNVNKSWWGATTNPVRW